MRRLFFLLLYLSVTAGLDFYMFMLLRRGFHWKRLGVLLFWMAAVAMMGMPILSRYLDGAGRTDLAAATALAGYAWLLALLWYTTGGLVLQAWNGAVWALSRWLTAAGRLAIPWPLG